MRAPRVLARASDIHVALGSRAILQGIDLVVGEREIVTVIGPNGAGKTTLLRVVLGLIKPARGRVEIVPELRIGYMPQRLAIDPILPLPVSRFLQLGGKHSREAIAAVLDEVGAPKVVDAPVQAVSGGEFQRVLLARALLRDPGLLVLDEPVQGVDIAGQAELFELIVRVRNRRGCGVLMVSHDLHLVMAATDTVVCINGHVCCTGQPAAVSRHPAYLALFGPLVAEGLAVYTHHHDHRHDDAGAVVPLDPAQAHHPHRHD